MLSQEIATPDNAAAVAYEVAMMRATAYRVGHLTLRKDTVPLSDRKLWLMERAAFLESFLIHYRNVMDFLSPVRPRQTDVTVGPFVGQPSGYQFPGAPLHLRESINQYLAHISTVRGTEDKEWRPGLMLRELDRVVDDFANQLAADTLRWFDRAPTALVIPGWTGLRSAPID